MMGPKKLSTIRDELRQHFSKGGQDPSIRLNQLKHEVPDATELIESLQRFIDGPAKTKPHRKKVRMAKKR